MWSSGLPHGPPTCQCHLYLILQPSEVLSGTPDPGCPAPVQPLSLSWDPTMILAVPVHPAQGRTCLLASPLALLWGAIL